MLAATVSGRLDGNRLYRALDKPTVEGSIGNATALRVKRVLHSWLVRFSRSKEAKSGGNKCLLLVAQTSMIPTSSLLQCNLPKFANKCRELS